MSINWSNILNLVKFQTDNSEINPGLIPKIEVLLIHLGSKPLNDDLETASEVIRLLESLKLSKEDCETYANCLIRIGRICNLLGYRNEALEFFEKAATLTKKHRFHRLFAIANMEIGEIHRISGSLEIAEKHQKIAITISDEKSMDREKADALNNFANVLIEKGNLDAAESYLAESLLMAELLEDFRLEGHIYNNLGVINCIRSKFDEAISDFMRALPMRELSKDEIGLAETYHNLALASLDSKKIPMAATYLEKAFKIARDLNDYHQETLILVTKTQLTFKLHDFDYALSMARQLIDRQKETEDQPGLAETNSLMGSIYMEKGILENAEKHFRIALDIFTSLELIPGKAETLKLLGLCFNKYGFPEKAEKSFREARYWFDQLGNESELAAIDALL